MRRPENGWTIKYMGYEIRHCEPTVDALLIRAAFGQLVPALRRFYPRAADWFHEKVLPGLDRGSRGVWLANENGRLAAIAISKSDLARLERAKICTLFVADFARGDRIGSEVLTNILAWHDAAGFSRVAIRCPEPVTPYIEPTLLQHGFCREAAFRTIPISNLLEVSFIRTSEKREVSTRGYGGKRVAESPSVVRS